MRIIAGRLKGRRLRSPTWPGLRPSSDRLRETLFNILSDRVLGALVLDACAGTGAIGFEALSRGAQAVTFVDQDQRAVALIAEHAARFGVANRCEIVCGAMPSVIADGSDARFHLILLDPPYDDPRIGAILSAVGGRLAQEGLLVLEGARRSSAPTVAGLEAVRRVVSGGSTLDFYRATAAVVGPEYGT